MKDLKDRNGSLYFIALVPNGPLREEIKAIKERIRAGYGAGHALKSPAHITLQMPFKRVATREEEISAALSRFASDEKSFMIDLDGYGAFPPRVIYIRITNPEPIRSLHRRLREVLLAELGFSHEEIMREVEPHITVATRDLMKSAFNNAWSEFSQEKFTGEFEVSSIFLLKHNGTDWDILKEFKFR